MTIPTTYLFVFSINITLFNVKENTMNEGLRENEEGIESQVYAISYLVLKQSTSEVYEGVVSNTL
jgi:hypothetical protein